MNRPANNCNFPARRASLEREDRGAGALARSRPAARRSFLQTNELCGPMSVGWSCGGPELLASAGLRIRAAAELAGCGCGLRRKHHPRLSMNRLSCLSLALVGSLLIPRSAVPAEALPPVNQWLPQETVAVLEISQPKALLDPLLSPVVADTVAALPAYQQLQSGPQFQVFQAVIKNLETQLGSDWRSVLRNLLGGGVALGAGATGETLWSIDAQDEKVLEKLHGAVAGIVGAQGRKPNQPDRSAPREYRGVPTWSFGPKDNHSILGRRLLLANRPRVLEAVLDQRSQPNDRSLASSPAYQAAKRALGGEAVASIFLNMEVVKRNPGLQRFLKSGSSPLAALLFANTGETLQKASWMALGFYVQGDKLTLKLVTDGPTPDPKGPGSFALPRRPGEGILPNLEVPGRIASMSLYRDLHGFYAAKDTLFPERTSGLIFFENMMGIFFSGMNLTEEVMGETQPEVRLVVATQQYDPAVGTPALQVPGFAAVFRLRSPQAFGDVVEEAWQKAIGLVNFTRGQKALPGLVIDRPSCGEVRYTVAAFRPPGKPQGSNLDPRYNFRPSLARVGDYLIMSSTDGLARQLIEALTKEAGNRLAPRPADHSLLEIEGGQLRKILYANREAMVRKNMVDKGVAREQAEAQWSLLFVILDTLNHARLSLGQDGGHPQAKLELRFQVPELKRSITMR